MSLNLKGRLKIRQEKSEYEEKFLKRLLHYFEYDIIFGHEASQLPDAVSSHQSIGTGEAFILFNKKRYAVLSETRFQHRFFPIKNCGKFIALELEDKHTGGKLLAVSWKIDSRLLKQKCIEVVNQLTDFISSVRIVDNIPVIIGGVFGISVFDALDNLPGEVSCHGYNPLTFRRQMRASDFFLTSDNVDMFQIQPLIFESVNLKQLHGRVRMNAEDVFYFDPVIAEFEMENLRKSVDPTKIPISAEKEEENAESEEVERETLKYVNVITI
ncbi:DgyrCDS3362 [Dimorphilus gyrociliatus]|uniref:DgyrCDS3362 n=1 Tax=Dimorphilus gyrociliatus TaxID=2664684 RepID=A0A7I8VI26_9ANNE|nr:DgyrCDS3362 [Dimorphilus gyrociliatus]